MGWTTVIWCICVSDDVAIITPALISGAFTNQVTFKASV